jgi:two-component system response regulator (stage 0 sporulation protein F)
MQTGDRSKKKGTKEVRLVDVGGNGKRVVFSQEITDNRTMKEKILIVEDEESLRLFYEEELKAEGYEILSARNGREAIQQLETTKPDIIILDIVMPVMDGMEALGRILRKGRKIPIILNTSYSAYRGDFMSWAADAYVTKSSDLTELKKKIRELLEKGKVR